MTRSEAGRIDIGFRGKLGNFLLDASFNTQNGIYTSSLAEGIVSAGINLWCIALGIATAAAMALPHAPSRA